MKIKSLPIGKVKAGPDDGLEEGEFVVYPSTFIREPDAYGDVVAKGAFLEGIKEWQESGDVMPGMYLHDPNQIVAGAIDMGEDDHGWWVKGRFDSDDPHAQKVYKWMKGRRLSALSFAYDTREEAEVELDDGRKANELRRLMPLEFSFLPKGFAANSDTSVVAVKALMDDLVLSSKSAEVLREARDAIDSVLSSRDEEEDGKSTRPGGKDDQEKASGEAEAKSGASDEEPEGAKSSVPDEEPKPGPSVARLAAQAHIYALKGAEGGSQ